MSGPRGWLVVVLCAALVILTEFDRHYLAAIMILTWVILAALRDVAIQLRLILQRLNYIATIADDAIDKP